MVFFGSSALQRASGLIQIKAVARQPPRLVAVAGVLGGLMKRLVQCLFALSFMTTVAAADDHLTGRATVIDGDTIEIHGSRIRLFGIDAPESSQLCRGEGSKHYWCGQQAANALFDFIANRIVGCVELDQGPYGRVIAVCSVEGIDLADWLVRHGYAMDYPRYSKGDYASAQREGKQHERGIWAGSLVEPWRFRACIRRGGRRASECSDEAQ
jgi:endonuclease YncB( thermonuclease family)